MTDHPVSQEAVDLLARELEPLEHWPSGPGWGEATRDEQETALACLRDARRYVALIAPALRSQHFKEFSEGLLSEEAKQAAAARWDQAQAEKLAVFMQSVRPGEVAQPMDNADVAGEALQAALATLPDTPEPDGRVKTITDQCKRELADLEASESPKPGPQSGFCGADTPEEKRERTRQILHCSNCHTSGVGPCDCQGPGTKGEGR